MTAPWQLLVTRQPSFKDIPFNCKSAETRFGRKLEDAETGGGFGIPKEIIAKVSGQNKKQPTTEKKRPSVNDVGLLPKKVTVTIEFDGNFYNATRDAFMAAVEEGGPGKLVLPTYDIYAKAYAEVGTMRFSDRRGGIESCTITFVIAGELTSPSEAKATQGKIRSLYPISIESGVANFTANSVVSGVESVFNAVVGDVQVMVDSTKSLLRSGRVKSTATGATVTESEKYDEVVGLLNDIEDRKEEIAADPELQAELYNEVYENVGEAFTEPEAGFNALLGTAETYEDNLDVVTGTGPFADTRLQNQIAALIFIQNACIVNAALLLSKLRFAVVEDVQTIRDRFTTAVRSLQATIGATSGYAETYRDLVQLNANVFDDLVERSAALPVIEERTIVVAGPSMTFAYAKYGDADRVTEILTRNDVKRSLFISGEVELLSR